jgi:hypothetical protein
MQRVARVTIAARQRIGKNVFGGLTLGVELPTTTS